MELKMYQVDAFASEVFQGNPAAVCPLTAWLPDATLLNIAQENNLSETAYLLEKNDHWEIRWFTPAGEIDLAGHPTLAAAWTIFEGLAGSSGLKESITFRTRTAGSLEVRRNGNHIVMDFPSRPGDRVANQAPVVNALGIEPEDLRKARDWMIVLPDQSAVMSYVPDFRSLKTIAPGHTGIIITAPGDEVDFVSRFFAPHLGIEDPVTGSAHCTLVPYWSDRLGKKTMNARQVSDRGGSLVLEHRGDRVTIAGEACLYMTATIQF